MIRSKTQYEARAKIAQALSHPTRLLLLDALTEKELCVSEMTELAGVDQSTVSKHLAILKETGFVKMEKRGTMSYYSIQCQCLDQFFGCIESVLCENVRYLQKTI